MNIKKEGSSLEEEGIEIIEHYKELNEQCDVILDKIKNKKHRKKANVQQI